MPTPLTPFTPFTTAIDVLKNKALTLRDPNAGGITMPQEVLNKMADDLDTASTFLGVANIGGMTALVSLIRDWGAQRDITGSNAKATPFSQFDKLKEEMTELELALLEQDQHGAIDAIGDMTVVLILFADLIGVRFEGCLLAAWEEIKDRRGRMENGIFIKEHS